jgi:small subunit ribosomal protein S17e
VVKVGKVRTEMVKRVAIELIDKYPKSFTTDFEHNNKFLAEIGLDTSKKMRNKIAGYVTRMIEADLAYEAAAEGEIESETTQGI